MWSAICVPVNITRKIKNFAQINLLNKTKIAEI